MWAFFMVCWVVTAKRDSCWARQAGWLLDSPSGMVAGLAKRDGYWARQAGWLLGSPSGMIAGPVKRDGCWARQAGWYGYWACQAT